MSPKELAEYIKVCKRYGVQTFEIGNVKVSLDPYHKPSKRKSAQVDDNKPPVTEREYSEEDVLLWSAGEGFGA